MKRICIIGSSCSGKSTMARTIAERSGSHIHIELDALHWLPNWVERTNEEFTELVGKAIEQEQWVIDGNYSVVRPLVWERADTVLWLDYSFPVVLWRSIRRSIHRALSKESICGGNTETLRRSFLSKDSIILWVLTTFHRRRHEYTRLLKVHSEGDSEYGHLRFIRLRSQKEADTFLQTLSSL
jgi:adenylate kinase family enzyme